MNKITESEIQTKSKNYVLETNEYLGTKIPKHLIQAKLKSDTGSTLFLLGIPDPIVVYASVTDSSQKAVTEKLFLAVNNSIADYIDKNGFVEGSIYYGEYSVNGSFEIGTEKLVWEDGNWGQIAKF